MAGIQDIRVHAPLVIAEGATLIFVCSVMVILRFYARRKSGSSLGLDDLAIALALLFVVGMAVTIIAGLKTRSVSLIEDLWSCRNELKRTGLRKLRRGRWTWTSRC